MIVHKFISVQNTTQTWNILLQTVISSYPVFSNYKPHLRNESSSPIFNMNGNCRCCWGNIFYTTFVVIDAFRILFCNTIIPLKLCNEKTIRFETSGKE